MYTDEEATAAKKVSNRILNTIDNSAQREAFNAGQILMWDEMRKQLEAKDKGIEYWKKHHDAERVKVEEFYSIVASLKSQLKASQEQPKEATEMALCEINNLILHKDQLYVFRNHEGCSGCEEYASSNPGVISKEGVTAEDYLKSHGLEEQYGPIEITFKGMVDHLKMFAYTQALTSHTKQGGGFGFWDVVRITHLWDNHINIHEEDAGSLSLIKKFVETQTTLQSPDNRKELADELYQWSDPHIEGDITRSDCKLLVEWFIAKEITKSTPPIHKENEAVCENCRGKNKVIEGMCWDCYEIYKGQ